MATLLIVDDDNLVRETLHELLSASHECHTADRAEQALAYLEIETYDVVLTDLAMPRLSGRDLLSHIQAKHPTTPVIVISGMFEEDDAREIIDAGAFAYFAKPFNLEEIEAAVDRAMVRRQELSRDDAAEDKITSEDATTELKLPS
ncbi:MAG TPA: response regulator [Pyrinomonadaceae bacterium]|nr:response regulator [Pyrinomonadaceae bacterium]